MTNITVIGIGRLGICTGLILERNGYNVLGVDTSEHYINSINNKTLISSEPHVMEYLKSSKNFKATTNLKEGLSFSNIIFIVVPTPNGGNDNYYDHSILGRLLMSINKDQVKNKHLIICCTVMPGYIKNIAKELICDCTNTTLNYNPEFIAQGSIIKDFESPDIILIGEENKDSGNVIENIYMNILHYPKEVILSKICRMSPQEAELTKISINGYITTKISYANMISDICDKTNLNKNVVLNAVGKDSRIGNKYLKPGFSYGGPCFPRDTKALNIYMKSIDIDSVLIDGTEKYNDLHVQYQTEKILNENKVNTIVINDVAYKENCSVAIIENSAKLKIAKLLVKSGKHVIIQDRKEIIDLVKLEYGNMFEYLNDV